MKKIGLILLFVTTTLFASDPIAQCRNSCMQTFKYCFEQATSEEEEDACARNALFCIRRCGHFDVYTPIDID